MIPILFNTNEKKFDTNGIGRLLDAVSCKVMEEKNGIYELELQYPLAGNMFRELKHSRIIYAVPSEGKTEQPFRIYKITKPTNGSIKVYAEHISYQMLHIPVVPFTAGDVQAALLGLKSNAAEECPFEFWTDKSTTGNFEIEEPANMRFKLVGSTGSVLDVYGGELEYDKYKVYLHNKRGADNGVLICYGKNLTDLKQEENIQNTVTGIVPYYKNSDGSILMLPEKTVHAENAGNYPYMRTVPMDLSSKFKEAPTTEQLRAAAVAYIKNNGVGVPSVSITVSFQQLWQTKEYENIAPLERVHLCDKVSVSYEALGVKASATVNKTVYDVLLDRYDSIELGDVKSSISDRIIEQKQELEEKPTVTFLEQAILNATEQITGIKGGYIVFRYDANKQPYEMLIMDQKDIEKAKNVWRFNQGGIGHSSSGYNGPYKTAITQDGKIVADFIATGTLMANLIKAGIISDLAGKNYWNIETGELVTENINMLGGQINLESSDKGTARMTLKAGDWVSEVGPFGITYRNGKGKGGGKYVQLGDGMHGTMGITIGTWQGEDDNPNDNIIIAEVYQPRAEFGYSEENGKVQLYNADAPTFSFKSADGKTIKVHGGVISEVS